MSNAQAKAERSKAKDIRQGIIDQPSVKSKSRKRFTHRITAEWSIDTILSALDNGRFTYGKYTSLTAAQQALKSMAKYKFYTNVMLEEI